MIFNICRFISRSCMFLIIICSNSYAVIINSVTDTIIEGQTFDQVKSAHDGQMALQIYDEFKPEMVLCDISLPVMDGFEITKLLKSKSNPPKIILVSGYSDPKTLEKQKKAGADDFIVKPYSRQQILDIIAIHS